MPASPFTRLHLAQDPHHPCPLIAGPCSAETEAQTLETARALAAQGVHYYRASLWKPRTRPGSFEGVGQLGLPWLRRVETELGMQALTEVATAEHVEEAYAAGLRAFWIGARTTASPFAIAELAEALNGRDVLLLVKNPPQPDLELWEGALMRLQAAGITRLGAIHRGFSTYARGSYRNAPLWQLPIELQRRHPELTILVDPSHIAGDRKLVPLVARMGLEMNFSGLIIETHCTPEAAWSDAAQQLSPLQLQQLLQQLDLGPASPSAVPSLDLDPLRAEIDHLDGQLLSLLSERMQIAERIGALKRAAHLPIVQPERYRQLLEARLQEGRARGLDEGFVRELFSSIHEAAVHVQQAAQY